MRDNKDTLLQSWRWFGPGDPVKLSYIAQAGAEAVVTALHHLPNGVVWSIDEIEKRKRECLAGGLPWAVVESVPVHEDIKRGAAGKRKLVENYKQTLRNLGRCGIRTVCYNFMPILDWTRTDLRWKLPDGAEALRFDMSQLAAFDLFMLRRRGAEADYTPQVAEAARRWFERSTGRERLRLKRNILAGLPGAEEGYDLKRFAAALAEYAAIGEAELRGHLYDFVSEVGPVAEEAGVRLAIHPDDPPFGLFGLPRVVSTGDDLRGLLAASASESNGICFCAGSLGSRPDGDVPGLFGQVAPRVHFLHLRSVQPESDGSFYETAHLEGSAEAPRLLTAIIREQKRRKEVGREDVRIPMRPDHGARMLDDLRKRGANPGYTAIGRLRGLAELRGLEIGLRHALESDARYPVF
ncbi:MAG: mannonate dehydratase [Saprospiraceae bacterium]